MFKIKDGYRLDLQTPETMKLYGITKNWQTKQKTEKMSVPKCLKLIEIVLVQCNLVDNQY